MSGAPVNKMAVNYHEGEMDPSGSRVWWNSPSLPDILSPHIGNSLMGSSQQQQQQQQKQQQQQHGVIISLMLETSGNWRTMMAMIPKNRPTRSVTQASSLDKFHQVMFRSHG